MPARIISCLNCGSSDHAPLLSFRQSDVPRLGPRLSVVVCRACGLCFLNPQPSHDLYLAYYRTKGKGKAPEATMTRERILGRKRHYRAYARWIAGHTALPKKARILEMGSSFGALLHFLRELGYENVMGVEASERSSGVARRALGLKVLSADALSSGLPPESFDLIIGLALVEHFTDPRLALQAMAELLAPGGFLYLNTHDLHNFTARKGFSSFFKFVHPFYFTERTLTSLLMQSGFRVLRCLTLPAMTASSSLIFPENCLHGEINIIAQKTGRAALAPLGDDYRAIIRRCRLIFLRDVPWALAHQCLFMRWGRPLRKIRHRLFGRFRRDPHREQTVLLERDLVVGAKPIVG